MRPRYNAAGWVRTRRIVRRPAPAATALPVMSSRNEPAFAQQIILQRDPNSGPNAVAPDRSLITNRVQPRHEL